MLAGIHHRGPDANGIESLEGPGTRSATFGAVRLRIIDLDPTADQPMSNATGDIWTVFNGEIYNFRELRAELEAAGFKFRSSCDTECLVHLYQHLDGDVVRIANRLRGMFAFAIWDSKTGRVVLARDRLGIKPLYWTPTNDGFAFCSEQRALAKCGVIAAEPNLSAVAGYLAKGVVPSDTSLLSNVEHLAAGHCMTWTGGQPEITEWWRPVLSFRADLGFEDRAQTELGNVVTDAVSRHLVADRRVGVFLSSGTDSAAVATIAAHAGAQESLTLTFPDDPSLDEGSAAAATASRLGTHHHEVPMCRSDALVAMEPAIASFDSPTADGFNSWLLARAAKQAGMTVVLSGLGGDELLAGYPTFTSVPRLRRMLPFINATPHGVRRGLARALDPLPRTRPWTRALEGGHGYGGAYHLMRRLFGDREIETLGLVPPALRGVSERLEAVDAVTLLEIQNYLRAQLLPDADTTSMAHSIELRVPLLDDRVVSTALAFPPHIRANGKRLLAAAAGLPHQPAKRPFALPMQDWIDTSLQAAVRGAILDDSLPFADILPRVFREKLWHDTEQKQVHWAKPWSVAVLRLWPHANGFDW